mmetsp:Transcript_42073/g.71506  ORF Transcript_42073/g.71506 Transcript_42073/m.71506 type:complete len:442 (+) Transcript_42073:369-1694(+)
MICGNEGELLVCDYPGCPKVYHKNCCWPASATATDDDATWHCPRHQCVVCTATESDPGETSAKAVSLFKCSKCTLSCCEQHAPAGAAASFTCSYCAMPPPPRVELAKILEEAWSKMGNHYLALPFMRPLLSVVSSSSAAAEERACDLLDVLTRIRTLRYTTRAGFLTDLSALRDRASTLSQDSPEIMQAHSTLLMIATQVLTQGAARLGGIEALIKSRESSGSESVPGLLRLEGKGVVLVGMQGLLVGVRLPGMSNCRSIEQWEAYIRNSPVKRRGDDYPTAVAAAADTDAPGDIAALLLELAGATTETTSPSSPLPSTLLSSKHPMPNSTGGFGGEVEHLLDSESAMLRQMLTSHASLRSEWRKSKEKLLIGPEAGEENAITFGEAHVLLELQVAHQNLRAQLEQNRTLLAQKSEELRQSQMECLQLKKLLNVGATTNSL